MTKKPDQKPRLNARQEAFCRGLAEGKSQTQAYLDAGYDGRGNAAATGAVQLLRNSKIVARVAELRAKAARRVELTVIDMIAELEEARQAAFKYDQAGAAVAASMGKAKLLGLVVDRQELRATVIARPSADENAPAEMGIEDWQRKYGGHVVDASGHAVNGNGHAVNGNGKLIEHDPGH